MSIECQAELWAGLTIGKRTREEFLTRHELYLATFRANLMDTAATLLASQYNLFGTKGIQHMAATGDNWMPPIL